MIHLLKFDDRQDNFISSRTLYRAVVSSRLPVSKQILQLLPSSCAFKIGRDSHSDSWAALSNHVQKTSLGQKGVFSECVLPNRCLLTSCGQPHSKLSQPEIRGFSVVIKQLSILLVCLACTVHNLIVL